MLAFHGTLYAVVARRRPPAAAGFLLLVERLAAPLGRRHLALLPFVFFGAFQIVLLYLFGNSIIATDMFTNLFTTNPDEAGELLGNIWPAILIVLAIYLPLLWVATVEIRERRQIPYRTRRWLGFPGVVLFLLGCAALNPAREANGGKPVLKKMSSRSTCSTI